MPTPAALRVTYRDLLIYRRVIGSNLMSTVLQPLLYLLGIGLGVGALVDRSGGSQDILGDVSYFAFYSTALPATTAMFAASQQALWPTMDGFHWSNAYRAMIATPLETRDIATGLMVYYATRTAIGATGVVLALALFSDTRSWGLVVVVPLAALTGVAFAMPIAGWAATMKTDVWFPSVMRFVVLPMFLFGGAFYPISQLPLFLQPVAWVTPLWHGVELCRGAILGGLGWAKGAGHVGVLFAYILGGWAVAIRTFDRSLRP